MLRGSVRAVTRASSASDPRKRNRGREAEGPAGVQSQATPRSRPPSQSLPQAPILAAMAAGVALHGGPPRRLVIRHKRGQGFEGPRHLRLAETDAAFGDGFGDAFGEVSR